MKTKGLIRFVIYFKLAAKNSSNSQKISDRLIKPIGFTENYTSLCAYEVETGKNKFFNIKRITEENNSVQQNKPLIDKPDAFGFTAQNGEKFTVELKLSLRAYLLLKEEHPLVKSYIKENSKNNTYNLSIVVNNPKPIKRFDLGLLDDVEVVGSKKFQFHLKSFVYSVLENNHEDFGE
jgi:proteasome accessory factor C